MIGEMQDMNTDNDKQKAMWDILLKHFGSSPHYDAVADAIEEALFEQFQDGMDAERGIVG